MTEQMTADQIIEHLGLEAHPEGGWFVETWRDQPATGGRGSGSAIYFLLREGEQSRWHRVDAAEIWHHHAGAPLVVSIAAAEGNAAAVEHRLGSALYRGEAPQVVVPAGAWQAATSTGGWTLVSCTVSPAFEFEHFELAEPGWAPGGGASLPLGAESAEGPKSPASGGGPVASDVASNAVLVGAAVELRPVVEDDVVRLAEMRSMDAIEMWWPLEGRTPLVAVREGIDDDEAECRVVTLDGRVVGFIQWFEENDPGYRHAAIDIYLDPEVHGRGLGRDTVRTACQHLFSERGHHRITIDPAAENAVAIACYRSLGFQPVGTLRRHERTDDGEWRDGLLLDLLRDELT